LTHTKVRNTAGSMSTNGAGDRKAEADLVERGVDQSWMGSLVSSSSLP
jgi:hypothetical protein